MLSILRILLIPLFIALFLGEDGIPYAALCVLSLSFLTDVADGIVARRYNMVTELGKVLDPLADKATQTAVILVICIRYSVPMLFFLFIFIKETIMGIGAIYLKKIMKVSMIPSNIWGKSATGSFYLSSVAIMLRAPYNVGYMGLYVTLVLMAAAFISYLRIFLRKRKQTA
jgi:cardiolipin synthase